MHNWIDKAMLASRHVLVVFYLGLAAALAVYALLFLKKLWKFANSALAGAENQQLIDLLHLLDSALIASLVVTVALASYDSLVSRLAKDDPDAEGDGGWVAYIDPGNLKIKLAMALIAISSIHLLQIFLEVGNYDDRTIQWALAIHITFVGGAVALGVVDWMKKGKAKG